MMMTKLVIQTYRLSIILSPFVSVDSKRLLKKSSNNVTIVLL